MNKPRMIDCDAAAALMEPLTDLVMQAGVAILAVNRKVMTIEGKLDGSPVTEADFAADRIIGDGLARLVPDVPALSEERIHQAKPPFRGSLFLIDPLDGTKEFVASRGEFTVNLALVTNGTPLLGIIGAPALGWLWRGLVGRGAERLRLDETGKGRPEPIHTRPLPKPGEPWMASGFQFAKTGQFASWVESAWPFVSANESVSRTTCAVPTGAAGAVATDGSGRAVADATSEHLLSFPLELTAATDTK